MANLHFFYGTMGAAKSTKLIQDRYNFVQKGTSVWVIKPKTDRIPDPKIVTRIGLECPADIFTEINCDKMAKSAQFKSDIIMVDEIQFFAPVDIDNLVKISDVYNKRVFCYGLLVDIHENMFPAARHLIEVGAKLHELVCSCQMPGCDNLANHHLRYTKDGIIDNGESIIVDDGKVIYKSVCRKCYDKELGKKR